MTTLFGKVLVFVMMFAALGAVGLASWLAVDSRDFPGQLKTLNKEYSDRVGKARTEAFALFRILNEKQNGLREMPWDIEAQLFGGKIKTVAETKLEVVGVPGRDGTLE